ncbi:MAG: glycoside hydrolase 100 family protein [Candidatus ainarchaeum sp.]|nr:glycoside hydrolase 100 family protein [Candidatus ainarchaeum sp.]
MELIEKARLEAVKTVKRCINPHGLFASGTSKGYTSVWARDSMITLIGACNEKDTAIKKVFATTLETLAKHQSKDGQIPNCVDLFDKKRKPQVTFATLDSSNWFLLGEIAFSKAYNDKSLLKKHRQQISRAFKWLEYQDSGEDGLPEQQPTSDWQDAFPHNYGHVLNTQALYFAALKNFEKNKKAKIVKNLVNNGIRIPNFFDHHTGFFAPYVWKDHAGIIEKGNWFDSLANCLAIAFGLAETQHSERVLEHIEKLKINRPFPIKTIFPPIAKKSEFWHKYFSKCDARKAFMYLNGGIWPMIGGFYVAALVKQKKFEKAGKELEMLALADKQGKEKEWEFNEWLDGKTGKPKGGIYQAWSAGSYLFAYHCVKKKKILFFE